MTRFALLPSPFLGPVSWRAVRDTLVGRGHSAEVLDVGKHLSGAPGVYARLGQAVASQMQARSILVVHSGAGALVPSIAIAAPDSVDGAVFVDGLMPHPGRSWMNTVPEGMGAQLRASVSGGLAPSWPTWLPEQLFSELLPEPSMRAELTATAPRVPLAFLEEVAPSPPASLPPRRCAYVQLSASYDPEADKARQLGWRVTRIEANHLSIMTAPRLVAGALLAAAEEFGREREAPNG